MKASGYLIAIFLIIVSLPHVQAQGRAAGAVEILTVRPNFYVLAGGGANVGVLVGPDGLIVVDTGAAAATDKVLEAIDTISDKYKTTVQGADVRPKIRYIFNTSAHPDHVGGNEKLSRAGLTIFQTGGGLGSAVSNAGSAAILAHDNVTQRMGDDFPIAALPSEGFTGRFRSYYINDDGIQIVYQPAAYSDGDSIVTFRRADVIMAGEIFDMTRFPIIDVAKGGSIQGELAALNRLVDLAIPAVPLPWREGRTFVIPARGRVSDQADVVEYRDMVTYVRDVIDDMVKSGMTLDQVKKADPTFPHRARYGADSGPWTTDLFVEAVYKSLTARP